jgi:NaMN:DMB phosphoribosyltransferase
MILKISRVNANASLTLQAPEGQNNWDEQKYRQARRDRKALAKKLKAENPKVLVLVGDFDEAAIAAIREALQRYSEKSGAAIIDLGGAE